VGEWDRALFFWVNSWPDWLNPMMQFFSEGNKWWPVRIAFVALFVWLLSREKYRWAAIIAVLASLISNEATDVIKAAWPTLRPSDPAAGVEALHLRVSPLTSFGTASAHAANMAAVATVLMRLAPKVGAAFVAVAFFTGLARVYVGVHFPYQVVLGWTTGVVVGWLLVSVYRLLLGRKEAIEERSKSTDPTDE
jgi:undecaprenyl-diphosphatase